MRSHAKASSAGFMLGREKYYVALLAFASLLVCLLAFAPLSQASRVVVDGFGVNGDFGPAGAEGGKFYKFEPPKGIAVNNSGNGAAIGTIYVVDTGNNRVQRLSPSGVFERLWGFDVVSGGGTDFEICTVASECKEGESFPTTANGGQLRNPQGIAIDQTDGHVYVAEQGNHRVSEFDADGNFIRTWGKDVVSGGGTDFEICTVASECRQGALGTLGGEFGGSAPIGFPTVDPSGNVLVPDPANNRIQVFDTSGNFVRAAGGDVITNGATGTGTLSAASKEVTGLITTSKYFEVGQTVTSSGGSLPVGTKITAVSPTTLTLSEFPTANGTETVTAAAGTGNSASNEVQTLVPRNATQDGKGLGGELGRFNLTFEGKTTGATGTADMAVGSNVLTNVNTTSGEFAVGQVVSAGEMDPSVQKESIITAINPIAHTITLSKASASNAAAAGLTITAYEIPRSASAATLQSYLESLPNIAPGDVSVSGAAGGPWDVTFQGPRYSGADVPRLESSTYADYYNSHSFIGPLAIARSSNGLEVCSVAAECRSGAPGGGLGQFSERSPTRLAINSSGDVFAADSEGSSAGRILKFTPSLTSASVFGAATLANFTSLAPENLAALAGGSRIAVSIQPTVLNGLFTQVREILELDATDGSLEDTNLSGAGFDSIAGMAERDDTATLYLTTGSSKSPRKVLALDTPIASPIATMDQITTKGASTATFSGTVDPMAGIGVSCRFEYSTDQSNWTSVPEPACSSLSTGGGAQAVSENATGLVANTKYFVRLSVTRLLDPSSTKTSIAQSFSTDHVAPLVTNLGAVQVTDTSMRLVGQINPMHSATGYVFEYGDTPAFGSTTSAVNLGDPSDLQVVSRVIQGLTPNTTYYFRLTATNLVDSVTTSSKSAHTRATPLPLPDDRAYEMVSPVEKNGGGALSGSSAGAITADDGQAIQFNTTSIFGDPPGVQIFLNAQYVSRRTASGWQTKASVPAGCRTDLDGTVSGGFIILQYRYSRNLDRLAFSNMESEACPAPPLDPAAPLPSANLYLSDLTALSPSHTLIAPEPAALPVQGSFGIPAGAVGGLSADGNHVVYASTGKQTPDAPPVQITPNGNGVPSVYEWDDSAHELRLVSKDVSGNAITNGAIAVEHNNVQERNGTSADGSRIFFQSPASYGGPIAIGCGENCELYMREDATTTYDVSESECTSDCGGATKDLFEAASLDGSRVLFSSEAKLTDNDTPGRDLFLYTHSASPASDQNLTLVSLDQEPADGSASTLPQKFESGPQQFDASADLETVYFLASGQLVPGEPTTSGLKLYRWRWNGGSPSTEYLATLPEKFESSSRLHTTPDGEYLLLETIGQLSPAADQDADVDLYRWDQADGWLCVSCQQPGSVSGGPAIAPFDQTITIDGLRTSRRAITDDGQRVFFTTPESLSPDDLNEGKKDVYEWNDGTLSLISSGTDQNNVKLLGLGSDGSDVFFYTESRLVGWDVDEIGDIYDARIGGGFPEPPPEGAPCEGESCRGAGSVAGSAAGAGSAVFEGPGNQSTRTTTKRCPKGKRKVTTRGKTVCRKPRKQRNGKRSNRRHAATNRGATR